MTAVIHHGPPGSYKTFSIVQRVLIPALQAGRVVVTNIRGFNDIDRIRSVLGIEIPETAQIFYVEPDTAGYELMARFFHWAPAGALIAMDEGQRVFPTRDKKFDHLDQPDNIPIHNAQGELLIDPETGFAVNRPATLEISIDQHRHFNWDIYISTPNISKIHSEIRKCVEWGYRHRDNTGLLPWYKNTWTEFRHDSEQSGKSVAHYSGTPKRYKADFRFFDCYQSTATGTAKTSNENISVFRDPKLRIAFALVAITAIWFFYNVGDAYSRIANPNGQAAAPDRSASGQGLVSPGHIPVSVDAGVSGSAHVPAARAFLNPFKALYYVADINGVPYFEALLPDDRSVTLPLHDVERFGYRLLNSGSFFAFELNGVAVYAFAKPPEPPPERVATMERSATVAASMPFN